MPERHILEAFWETRERGLAVLAQDWLDQNQLPPLRLYSGESSPQAERDEHPMRLVRQLSPIIYGRRAGYFFNGADIEFVLWPPYYPSLDWEDETLFVGGDFNGWQKAINDPAWQLQREIRDGQNYLVLRVARDKCVKGKPVRFKFITADGRWQELPADVINRVRDGDYVNYVIEPGRTGSHVFHFWSEKPHYLLHRAQLAWVEKDVHETCEITNSDYLLSHYTDRPLGAQVEPDRTVFALFAPRASRVSLRIYDQPGAQPTQQVDLSRHSDGCWEATLPENLQGKYYDYRVDGENFDNTRQFHSDRRILDPYAMATVGREGPGLIIDSGQFPAARSCFMPPAWHDLVILETHVRDLLARLPIDLPPEERRGFKGLAKWLRHPECYLRTLGVNCIELQPVQEFDNVKIEDYHWGYMPVNYFSPASAYATDPAHGTQNAEFREVVEAFHDAGLAVILDVVYNHTGEPNHLFNIDKYYYFTCSHDGQLTNWSGCGNDLRTTTPMGRRLIIESLIHLVRTFDIDGFRFDLADLVGVAVLKEIEVALKAVKPSIILISEPWSMHGHITHALRHTGWTSWNDHYREFITQYLLGRGDQDGVRFFLTGSPGALATWPAQTVNYLQSHDDRAWLDRITENPGYNGESPTTNDVRRHHLMVAVLMSSLGIPMLAQGQDFLHSKQGVNNTYLRGDLNALDYARIGKFRATHDYFSAWIKFRLSPAGQPFRHVKHPPAGYFAFFTAPDSAAAGLLYNADGLGGTEQLFFAINPHAHPVSLETLTLAPAEFRQLANHDQFQPTGLNESSCFFWANGKLQLPALSVGLWQREKITQSPQSPEQEPE